MGKRILVLGCPGSGKSTLSRKIQAQTGLPLIHLDNLWWKPDRTHVTREEFDRKLETVLAGERWIIDGHYSRTYAPRIRACDTVIFLDYDEDTCMQGITERIGKPREDMPWTEQQLDPELAAMVRDFREQARPALLVLLAQHPEKEILIFQTREAAAQWLADGMPCKETKKENEEKAL